MHSCSAKWSWEICFSLINKNLWFEVEITLSSCKSVDPFARTREVFQLFTANCQASYSPNDRPQPRSLVVDSKPSCQINRIDLKSNFGQNTCIGAHEKGSNSVFLNNISILVLGHRICQYAVSVLTVSWDRIRHLSTNLDICTNSFIPSALQSFLIEISCCVPEMFEMSHIGCLWIGECSNIGSNTLDLLSIHARQLGP